MDGNKLIIVLDDDSIHEAIVGIDIGSPTDNGDGSWNIDTTSITG